VVGLSAQSAQASLQSAGFRVNVQTVAGPADTAAGDVWQQNPAANATEAPGTTVTILVQPQASPTPTGSPTGSPTATATATATPTGSPTAPASGGNGGGGGGGGINGNGSGGNNG